MKKVLLIVPHEDDELLIGGPLLIDLVRDGNYDVNVFVATNGDYNPTRHMTRICETLTVLSSIGIKKDHIFFGGYGDSWKGNHIYNSEDNEIKESHGGFNATYLSVSGLHEWHYQRFQSHIPYTRKGYLGDIEDLILTVLPDVIVCVDMDSHRDHRGLSLLTEEALATILQTNCTYMPIVLKKYAYEGVMFGRNDFFTYPHKRTWNETNRTCNPYYGWDERVSYVVPTDCRTLFLTTNYLFKLARMYHSQDTWVWSPRFINEDIVFWKRNTNNVLLRAEINVSSGNKKYLNDFKLIDTDDVNEEKCDYTKLCWRPDKNDLDKSIIVRLSSPSRIRYINVYFNTPGGFCGDLLLMYSDLNGNQRVFVKKLTNAEDFFVEEIEIVPVEVTNMKLCFKNVVGNLGVGEIEAMSEFEQLPFGEYLYREEAQRDQKYIMENVLLYCEKMIFMPLAEMYLMIQRFKRSIEKRKKYCKKKFNKIWSLEKISSHLV